MYILFSLLYTSSLPRPRHHTHHTPLSPPYSRIVEYLEFLSTSVSLRSPLFCLLFTIRTTHDTPCILSHRAPRHHLAHWYLCMSPRRGSGLLFVGSSPICLPSPRLCTASSSIRVHPCNIIRTAKHLQDIYLSFSPRLLLVLVDPPRPPASASVLVVPEGVGHWSGVRVASAPISASPSRVLVLVLRSNVPYLVPRLKAHD